MDSSNTAQQLLTAVAFIHRQVDDVEKVFLAKRAMTKKFLPGVWELSGGHVEFGEDMTEGLQREIREEHHMEICVGDPFHVFTYTNHTKKSHAVEVIYFATFIGPIEDIRVNAEDHSDYGWFGEDDLEMIMKNKGSNDPEVQGITRGFSILRGEVWNFG